MSIQEDQHPTVQLLRGIFNEMVSKDPRVATEGEQKLVSLVDEDGDIRFSRSHQLNSQSKTLSTYILSTIGNMFAHPETRFAGVRAISVLLEVDFCELSTRTSRFSALLLSAATDSSATTSEAIRAWGRLISNGSGLVGDITRAEREHVQRLLSDDKSSTSDKSERRYVACLILFQLADRAPMVLTADFEEFRVGLEKAIVDPLDSTRRAAAKAMRRFLDVCIRVESGSNKLTLNKLLDTATSGFDNKNLPVQLGAWLTLNAILDSCSEALANSTIQTANTASSSQLLASATASSFELTAARFGIDHVKMNRAWDYVLKIVPKSASMNSDARSELYNAIPLMAAYDKDTFLRGAMSEVLSSAMLLLRSPTATVEDKNQMFLMIGKLASVLKENISSYVDRIVRAIDANLIAVAKKPKKDRCPEAVTCLAMLAKADPISVRPYVAPLLNPIFAGAPSVEFARNIASLCRSFPELRSACLDRMIALIRRQLSTVPIRNFLTPSEAANTAVLLDAFMSIGEIDCTGFSMLSFLSLEVAPRFWDPHQHVRRMAADLCSRLLLCGCHAPGSPCHVDAEGTMIHVGAPHIALILRLQQQLLAVAVADPEPDIRLSTLAMLDVRFDHTLAMQDCVRGIFPALNDKHQNRAAAVSILGRLSHHNPAAVFPTLRKILVQCITEIEYYKESSKTLMGSDERKLEQATIILGEVVAAAPELIQPYRASLLNNAVQRLKLPDSSPLVLTALLACIGKLVKHTREQDLHIVRSLVPIVVSHILDGTSSSKKQEAIRTLTCIVRVTRDVNLYDEFPTLLTTLLSMLHGGFKEAWAYRRDALALLGAIGAVDPIKVKSISRQTKEGSDANANFRARAEDLPPTIVNAVIGVMKMSASNEEVLSLSAQALREIFFSGSMKMNEAITFLDRIIPEFRRHIANSPGLREKLLKELAAFVAFFKHHIRAFRDGIFDTIRQQINGDAPLVLNQCINLIIELRLCLREEFKPYLPSLLPLLVGTLRSDARSDRKSALLVLDCFSALGKLLDGHLHVVLPEVVDIASKCPNLEAREQAIVTIMNFAKYLPSISDHAARCVHCLLKILSEPLPTTKPDPKSNRVIPNSIHTQCLQALASIAQNLGDGFAKFIPMVRPALASRFREDSVEYDREMQNYTQAIVSGKRYLHFEAPCQSRSTDMTNASASSNSSQLQQQQGRLPDNQRFKTLRDHMSSMNSRTNDEEGWKPWLHQFCVQLLRSSPSAALRVCANLAQAHEPFARQLFFPAFASCFAEMSEMREQVGKVISDALENNKNVSNEVRQEILNLAEYMERVEEFTKPAVKSGGHKSSSSRSADPNGTVAIPTFSALLKTNVLATQSERCNLYAKTIHYLEAQFIEITKEFRASLLFGKTKPLKPDQWKQLLSICEQCIKLCNYLSISETANGILSFIRKYFALLTGEPTGASGIVQQAAPHSPTIASSNIAVAKKPHQQPSNQFSELSAEMYEKLQWWSQSLKAYEAKMKQDPQNPQHMLGVMKSLEGLGDYPRLLDMYRMAVRRGNRKVLAAASPSGARAAWLMQMWDDLKLATDHMPQEGYNLTIAQFYKAVLAAHNDNLTESQNHINECRRLLDQTLTGLISESYDRAYPRLVDLQQLSELEEICQAKRDMSLIGPWHELWQKRLMAMAHSPAEWQGTLANHTLVLAPQQELSMWIQFVNLCRGNHRNIMAQAALNKLLNNRTVEEILSIPAVATSVPSIPSLPAATMVASSNSAIAASGTISLPSVTSTTTSGGNTVSFAQVLQPSNNATQPIVALAALSHMYESGKEEEALNLLGKYIDTVPADTSSSGELALCRAKLSEWLTQQNVQYVKDAALTATILSNLKIATELDPSNGPVWHQWARVQHDVVDSLKKGQERDSHIVAAIEGYLSSIRLGFQLQDALGFLSLWFSHGSRPAVHETVVNGLPLINVNVWLSVIPQIIARIQADSPQIQETVFNLLVTIAKTHPQALLYTLNAGIDPFNDDSEEVRRRKPREKILGKVEEIHGQDGTRMVSEARMVTQELIRCAVLWPERWLDELQVMHRQWMDDGDLGKVVEGLTPLVKLMDDPRTASEENFVQENALHIREAFRLMQEAVAHKTPSAAASKAKEGWALFDDLYNKFETQVKNVATLVMEFVSPRLVSNGRNQSLAVPGTYVGRPDFPRIASFVHEMRVINSKQHPRRIGIIGNDGVRYIFLLKGHEDLRQDERVMQLLGLVNTVLETHNSTKRRDCTAQLYSVTPLGDRAGLVGWVDACDTLHAMIKEYRGGNIRAICAEQAVIKGMISDVEEQKPMVIQKQEFHERAHEPTEGMDIARSLWSHAPSAEVWLDRRTTYVRTLASMSMVGHVLGLGDRHPSNLMLHTASGRIVHIDFGDCFEVAMKRSMHPEKVPFRLTRMLINAMEVSGIDGLYRHSCETVMDVLRKERTSMLAMLEAFLHDPLVSWQLGEDEANATVAEKVGATEMAGGLQSRLGGLGFGGGIEATEFDLTAASIRSLKGAAPFGKSIRHGGGAAVMTVAGGANNKQATEVISRIREKLNGLEFTDPSDPFAVNTNLPVAEQVDKLIQQATACENLCQHYQGWCAFW